MASSRARVTTFPMPAMALSDGAQSLDPAQFTRVAARIREVVAWTGKTLG